MDIKNIAYIGFFAFILFLTLFSWKEIINYGALISKSPNSIPSREGFTNEVDFTSDAVINNIIKTNEPVPTDTDAIAAHQTLLRYIRNDFMKGIRFVNDFGDRFFGDNLPLRSNLDPRTLMDNYRSPL